MREKGIVVTIPERVYVSYDPDRTVKNEFYFTIFKEFPSDKSKIETDKEKILQSPKIYIQGFEQFLKIKQPTPQQQEAQIIEAVQKFIDSLVYMDSVNRVSNASRGSNASLWSVDYTYDRSTESLSIVITYTDTELASDFFVKFSSSDFICNTRETQKALVLTIHTEGFETVFEDAKEYQDYRISSEVQYAPCITKFMAKYGQNEYENSLFVSPMWDNKLELNWSIAGNGRIEHTLEKDGVYLTKASVVDAIEDSIDRNALYTLRADNQRGFTDVAQLSVRVTNWHREGEVKGLLKSEERSIAEGKGAELFLYNKKYYCYREKMLYESQDGCDWKEYSENMLCPTEDGFVCMAGKLYGQFLYIMGGVLGKRLKIMRFDFVTNQWSCESAYQNCISSQGRFAFSSQLQYYAQVTPNGISVCGHRAEDDWRKWNQESFEITPQGYTIKMADLCFWKDSFYAVVLGEDGNCYFYKCDEEIEEALFEISAKTADKVTLLPTRNHLYILIKEGIYTAISGTRADEFFPPAGEQFWLGSDSEHVFGIFSDNNFWIYEAMSI